MEQETRWHFLQRAVVTNNLPRIRVREGLFPNIPKRLRPLAARACSAIAADTWRTLRLEGDHLFRRLEICTHIEYNCSRNEYNNWFGGSSLRSDARSCTCPALRPC